MGWIIKELVSEPWEYSQQFDLFVAKLIEELLPVRVLQEMWNPRTMVACPPLHTKLDLFIMNSKLQMK
jgi:hypothetical protein